jgi:hypothetical protein
VRRELNPIAESADKKQLKMENKTYRDLTTGNLCADRRSGVDRRAQVNIWDLLSNKHSRRKSRGRRKTDKGAYVDVYDVKSVVLAIAVLILSLIDALFTRMHLVRGSAQEWNPLLNAIINHGGLPAFFAAKAIMTAFPMALILVHKEWNWGKYAAQFCLFAYILITFYHLCLIANI